MEFEINGNGRKSNRGAHASASVINHPPAQADVTIVRPNPPENTTDSAPHIPRIAENEAYQNAQPTLPYNPNNLAYDSLPNEQNPLFPQDNRATNGYPKQASSLQSFSANTWITLTVLFEAFNRNGLSIMMTALFVFLGTEFKKLNFREEELRLQADNDPFHFLTYDAVLIDDASAFNLLMFLFSPAFDRFSGYRLNADPANIFCGRPAELATSFNALVKAGNPQRETVFTMDPFSAGCPATNNTAIQPTESALNTSMRNRGLPKSEGNEQSNLNWAIATWMIGTLFTLLLVTANPEAAQAQQKIISGIVACVDFLRILALKLFSFPLLAINSLLPDSASQCLLTQRLNASKALSSGFGNNAINAKLATGDTPDQRFGCDLPFYIRLAILRNLKAVTSAGTCFSHLSHSLALRMNEELERLNSLAKKGTLTEVHAFAFLGHVIQEWRQQHRQLLSIAWEREDNLPDKQYIAD